MSPLSQSQRWTIDLAERIASGISLAGLSFIIISFMLLPPLRKPIHRLMFYAAWGDAVYNIATLVATAGVSAGEDSALCQFQGFTIEMFLWTDTLWNLAMALDVYLTVFRKYDNFQLKSLEKWYLGGIYGFSFLLSFSLIFAQDDSRGKVYGPAVIWCWISLEWDFMRMVMLYGPVWVMIIAITVIYIVSGLEIWRKDREIRNFPSAGASSVSEPEPVENFKMTEVHVSTDTTVSTLAKEANTKERTMSWADGGVELSRPASGRAEREREASRDARFKQYSVTVETRQMPPSGNRRTQRSASTHKRRSDARNGRELNNAAWAYTKCAFLFFIALLITWLPSSINRVYSLLYPETFQWSFNLGAAIVLPLMGFWNTIIYIVTSWSTLRSIWRDWRGARKSNLPARSPAALEASSSQEDLTHSSCS